MSPKLVGKFWKLYETCIYIILDNVLKVIHKNNVSSVWLYYSYYIDVYMIHHTKFLLSVVPYSWIHKIYIILLQTNIKLLKNIKIFRLG